MLLSNGGGAWNVNSHRRVRRGSIGTTRFNYGRLRKKAIVPAAPIKRQSLRNRICNEVLPENAIVYRVNVAALGGQCALANSSDG